MKHAGVAVTITSVTDLLAFGIGAASVLPALSSFCIYASVGILFLFMYMATFFLAIFTLDQRRIDDRRDGIICCWKKSPDWTPNKCSQMSLTDKVFSHLAETLIKLPVKIVILVLTSALLGVSIYGVTLLETDFDVSWFLQPGSYLQLYVEANEKYFPSNGISGQIYVADLTEYGPHLDDIEKLTNKVATNVENIKENGVESFIPDFKKFLKTEKNLQDKKLTETEFRTHLTEFLFNPKYMGWRRSFKFKGDLECGKVAPEIRMMTFSYMHSGSGKANVMIESIKEVDKEVESVPLKGRVFAHSGRYNNYITMGIITTELLRNIALALVAIFICTLVLIANFFASLIVVVNVFITLINVGAFMQFWGLTVDTSSAVLLTVAMGLAVDYGAHIGMILICNQLIFLLLQYVSYKKGRVAPKNGFTSYFDWVENGAKFKSFFTPK